MDFSIIGWRAGTAALVLAALWTFEGIWPMFLGRERRGGHYATNLSLGLVNAGVTALVFAGGLLLVSEYSRQHGVGMLHWLALPAWLSWIVAIVAIDAWQYLWHVLNHKIPLLWRFHAVHHSDADLDASTALRFHTGEIVLSGLSRLAVLPVLGVTITQLAAYELLLLPIIMLHHSNVRLPRRLDRWARWLIVTPRMHWVHHSKWQPETDSNYASIFSFWDRIFRTFRLRKNAAEIELGLDGFEEREWRSLPHALAIPFRHNFNTRRAENVAAKDEEAAEPSR